MKHACRSHLGSALDLTLNVDWAKKTVFLKVLSLMAFCGGKATRVLICNALVVVQEADLVATADPVTEARSCPEIWCCVDRLSMKIKLVLRDAETPLRGLESAKFCRVIAVERCVVQASSN